MSPAATPAATRPCAAKVMGIIGTVVLVLGIAALVAVFAFAVSSGSSSDY